MKKTPATHPLSRRQVLLQSAALALAGGVGAPAIAQAPGKPITMIVPVSPGSAVDSISRLIQPRLSQRLGVPVVVDNRTGASGIIGMTAVARAQPDGNTILMSPSSMATLALQKDLPWNALTDFQPVARLAAIPYGLVVTPSLPVKDARELLELARSKPGELNFASPGVGTPQHMVGELFRQATKINVVHVPYKTSAGATTDLAGGQVQFSFQAIPVVASLVKAGRMRMIATLTDKRTPWTPEVPTLLEGGIQGVANESWVAAFLPKGTPRDIAAKYAKEMGDILNTPDVREELVKGGFILSFAGPDELGAQLKRDIAVWQKVVDEGRIVLTTN